MRPCIILPIDGKSGHSILTAIEVVMKDPVARSLISHVKLNDVLHDDLFSSTDLVKEVIKLLKRLKSKAKLFLDFKIADTSGTNANTLKRYQEFEPDIVTIRSDCSFKGFLAAKQALPNTKLALVSVLTDMSEEECLRRFNMTPSEKIIRDMRVLWTEAKMYTKNGEAPFEMVVCSPLELESLGQYWGDKFQFIVPGIRDSWMLQGQQRRTMGVKDALDGGADFVVMGSQMTKGNLGNKVSAEISRKMTVVEIQKSWRIKLLPGDFLGTLKNFKGYYSGTTEGPLVAYAGDYDAGEDKRKNYVGFQYVNLSVFEQYPNVLRYFVLELADKIRSVGLDPEVVVGVPTGGSYWGIFLADALNCRFVSIDKKKISETDEEKGVREKSEFLISRHEILPQEKVLIVEDLVNNFSSTAQVIKAIQASQAQVVGIASAFNRSEHGMEEFNEFPVISLVVKEIPQYYQEDKIVKHLVEAGKVVFKAKDNWDLLQAK